MTGSGTMGHEAAAQNQSRCGIGLVIAIYSKDGIITRREK